MADGNRVSPDIGKETIPLLQAAQSNGDVMPEVKTIPLTHSAPRSPLRQIHSCQPGCPKELPKSQMLLMTVWAAGPPEPLRLRGPCQGSAECFCSTGRFSQFARTHKKSNRKILNLTGQTNGALLETRCFKHMIAICLFLAGVAGVIIGRAGLTPTEPGWRCH